MTKDEAVIAQTIEQLERMNRVLEHLRKEVLPKNAKMFALMAEGRGVEGQSVNLCFTTQTSRYRASNSATAPEPSPFF